MFQKFNSWLINNRGQIGYTTLCVLAMVFGYLLKTYYPQIKDEMFMKYLSLPGTIVGRIFCLIVVPMIITSLATSIGSAKSSENKKILKWTFTLFCIYSSLAPLLGSALMFIVRPGVQSAEELAVWKNQSTYRYNPHLVAQGTVSKEDTLLDFIM
ncbi:unnamed protein product [Oppiella nova]|uniref:Amino acid transporter n=1 Tax=Oppiella nova TaxID=334625 RepID=A0A7R9LMF5_9ACAR|nr:unnamed protein product [Oppiella nova]CAG2165048.1 unnamed protein product [Oppiella nova]